MTNLRDLKVGDIVYVVERYVVTKVTDSVATLNNTLVTTMTAVDTDDQATLERIYLDQD